MRTLIAQISDPHLSVEDADSAEALRGAVRAIADLDPAPDAVLLSGDVTNRASDADYQLAAELIAPLALPVHVLAGNHDDADLLRAWLGAPGDAGTPLQYSVRIGDLRLVVCDTSLTGRDDGALGPERLGWIESDLASDRATPTILAMHHPPLHMGIPAIDELALAEPDRLAVGELVARNPQVRRIVGGHVHRAAVGALNGCAVFACPSTYLQLALDLTGASGIVLVREPPALGLHVAIDGNVTSHFQPIGDYGRRFLAPESAPGS